MSNSAHQQPRAMISSTVRDLPQHRESVRKACLDTKYYFPLMMEHMPAQPADAIEASLEYVDQADVYIGVFAHRYGYVPPGHEKSITEMEYDRAVQRAIPRLIFFMHDEHPITFSDVEGEPGRTRITKLKERIGAASVAGYFRNSEELHRQVLHALMTEREKRRAQTRGLPTPQDFGDYLQLKRMDFCGREWLFEEIKHWASASTDRTLLIVGDPGSGKSAIAAEFARRFESHLLACYCCQAELKELLKPSCFVHSVAASIAARLPEYATALADDAKLAKWLEAGACANDPVTAFQALVVGPLSRIAQPDKYVKFVLVDALDEAMAVTGEPKSIVDVLAIHATRLPSWVRLVATTRKEQPVLSAFAVRKRVLDAQDNRNLADIEMYIAKRLSSSPLFDRLATSRFTPFEVCEILRTKSGGNFLYVQQALAGIETEIYTFHQINELPPGLDNLYRLWFQRQFPTQSAFEPAGRLLQVVVAAKQPLDRKFLARAAALDEEEEAPQILSRLSGYLREHNGAYALYHHSLQEWLTSEELRESLAEPRYYVSAKRGHQQLAEYGWQLRENGERLPKYFERYLPEHLKEAKRWEQLQQFLCDLELFDRMWSEGRKYEWMRHWQSLKARRPTSEVLKGALQDLASREGKSERVCDLSDRMGCFLRDMGEDQAALPFLEQALELGKEIYGDEHPETATRMHNLAETHRRLDNHETAQPLYEEALRIRLMIYPNDHEDVAISWHDIGEFVHDLQDYKRALEFYLRSLEIRRRLLEPNHWGIGDCINDIGVVYLDMARQCKRAGNSPMVDHYLNKAIGYFDQAKSIFDAAYGPDNPDSATADLSTAMVYAERQEHAMAIELATRAIKVFSGTLCATHTKVHGAQRCLAEFHREVGDLQASLGVVEQEVNQLSQELGKEHKHTLAALHRLIATHLCADDVYSARRQLMAHLGIRKLTSNEERLKLAEQQRGVVNVCLRWSIGPKAIPLCNEATSLLTQVYGDKHLELCPLIQTQAELFRLADQQKEALSALRRLLNLQIALLGREHASTLFTVQKLAATHLALGEVSEARTALRSHWGIGDTLTNGNRLTLAQEQLTIVGICHKWSIVDKAIPFAEEALNLQEQVFGRIHLELCKTIETLAVVYQESGSAEQLTSAAARLLEIRESLLGSDHEKLAETHERLAAHFEAVLEIDKAEEHLLRMLRIRERLLEADPLKLVDVLNRMKAFYEKHLQFEKASNVGKRLVDIYEQAESVADSVRAFALNNLGFSYIRIARYTDAERCLCQALELYKNCDLPDTDSSATLNNLAEALLGQGRYDEAEARCREALKIRNKAKDPKRLAISQTTLATICWKRGRLDEAETWLKRAMGNHDRASLAPCAYRVESLRRYAIFLRDSHRGDEAAKWEAQIKDEVARLNGQQELDPSD